MTKWIQNWKRNNWKLSSGGEVKNQADLKELDRLRSTLNVKWVDQNIFVLICINFFPI